MKVTEIITDQNLREIRQHGSDDFPFAYYEDEILEYIGQAIDWHWHREFEFIP